ncbi:MAG: hypothetical protein ACFFCZ_22890 [Promethearchaeota archaeon]
MNEQATKNQTDLFIYFFCVILSIGFIPSFVNAPYLSSAVIDFMEANILWDPIKALLIMVMTFLLILYTLVSLFFTDFFKENKSKYAFYIKIFCILCASVVFVIIPTANNIFSRLIEGPHLFAHDGGVIQSEEALKFFLAGVNPYSADFSQTPMVDWAGWSTNPALWHIPYLPLSFLLSLPLYILSMIFLGWYDQRFLYLLLYYPTIYLASKLAKTPSYKLGITSFVALSPAFTPLIVYGYNDILILFWVILSIYFLKNGRKNASLVALACACATKQTSWMLLPFYFAFFWQKEWNYVFETIRTGKFFDKSFLIYIKDRIFEIFPFILVFSLIVLPFFLWNPADFIDDIFLFNVGLADPSYFIKGDDGYGIGTLVLLFGWVSSIHDYFPFWIFQVLFGAPVIIMGFLKLKKNASIANLLNLYVLIGMILFFFSRFFHGNYIAYFLTLLGTGILISYDQALVDQQSFESYDSRFPKPEENKK